MLYPSSKLHDREQQLTSSVLLHSWEETTGVVWVAWNTTVAGVSFW